MIDVNKTAFSNLIEQYLSVNRGEIEDAKRYIKTENEEEKDWIKSAKIIETLRITPSLRVIQIQFQGKIFFAVVGTQLETNLLDNTVLFEIELNAGLVTLLISERLLRLDKKSNNLEFYDFILFQHQENSYKGHNYSDLIDFLEEIHFFAIPENFFVDQTWTSRIACYIFSKNKAQLILDFEDRFIDFLSELSIVGSDKISYKILVSCLFSNSYKHAFLELYRLIERLFSISYLKEFYKVTNTNLDFLNFVSQLEKITKWRPKEEDAVEKIFNNSKPSTRCYFQVFHDSSPILQSQNDYVFFYNLRNSIVHFRANHLDYDDLTNHQWNLLLYATIYLIDEQYSSNNELLKNK